jgi:hypothetical protein
VFGETLPPARVKASKRRLATIAGHQQMGLFNLLAARQGAIQTGLFG